MQKKVQRGIGLAALLAALVLFMVFGLPALLKAVLEAQIAKNMHRAATVEAVSFNPFQLCLTVRGLSIRELDTNAVFVSCDLLRVNAEITSIFQGGIELCEFTLVNPYVHIIRTGDNTYSFTDLLPAGDKKPAPEPSEPVLFSIANIRITGGAVDFDDRPKKVAHRITDIELGLPLISNFNQNVDIFVQPSFSAAVNGKPFKLTGQSKPFIDSLETNVAINITDLSLAKYLPYVPAALNFQMPSGRLSTHLVLYYIQRAQQAAEIKVEGRLLLEDLEIISLDEKPILKLPSFAVSGIDCRINDRELVIDDIALKGLSVALAREKDGSISLQKLVGTDTQTAGKPEPAPKEPEAGPAWSVQVKKLACADGAVVFTDRLPALPAQFRLVPIDFTLSSLSTAPDSPAAIDGTCRINGESSLGMQGAVTIEPLGADLNIDLAALDIRFARSYMPETLLLDLTSGKLDLNGSVAFKQAGKAEPAIVWQGDISLADFAATRRGDKKELVQFSSLDLLAMHAGTGPLFLDIQTVKLAGFFIRPVVEADGTVNLTSLSAAPEAPASKPAAAAEKEPLPKMNIGSLVLEKGRLQFTDTSIKPRYRTELANINGRITGISTKPESQARIELSAKLNRYAPCKIMGTIQPLQEKLTADIKIAFNNIDLPPFSPYAGKFIGRVIDKGSLSFDLAYKIRNNKLSSQNKVFIDQFTLGKSVKSPDATSLPVGLALALLKDRKGGIHLDLPVDGSLDDPSFRVGKVILQTLVNLLEKAATAPFALVGALIPQGMDISSIAFPCGTAELDDEAIKKLEALAGLLIEKPGLNLEIQAGAEADPDHEGLRQEMVLSKMRRLKFADLSKKEREGLAPEKVVITANEYEDYLWQAYKAGKFKKQTFLGLTKKLPAEEMKKLLLEHTTVSDADMKELQRQRCLRVKQYLSQTANVPAARLFIVGPRTESGTGAEGCAVQFNLK